MLQMLAVWCLCPRISWEGRLCETFCFVPRRFLFVIFCRLFTFVIPRLYIFVPFRVNQRDWSKTERAPAPPTLTATGTLDLWQGMFEDAVSTLLPLRYHLDAIGGSKAQQDVVHVTLVDAAMRLPDQVCLCTWVCCGRGSSQLFTAVLNEPNICLHTHTNQKQKKTLLGLFEEIWSACARRTGVCLKRP